MPRTVILFDVSRIMLRPGRTPPTGIDRVTEAYFDWLQSRPDVELWPVCSWAGVIWPLRADAFVRGFAAKRRRRRESSGARLRWRRLLEALAETSDAVAPPRPVRARWDPRLALPGVIRVILALWDTARLARPRPLPAGAVYLNVSHFGLEQNGVLDRLKAKGVRSVIMLHDLIPIRYPEYCSPGAARLHLIRFEAALRTGAAVIANSEATRQEIEAYAIQRGLAPPPVSVAPLGLEAAFCSGGGDEPGDQDPDVREDGDPEKAPRPRPYFVCVGTLEPRKNLTFLLTLWRRIAERDGANTPHLVLLGQRGWENEAIIDLLERSPAILRYVHETQALDDACLAELIQGARALLSPSFAEGFDLPVNEALALGTPVIASDIPVHREFAGKAVLLDPLDGPGWETAIRAHMTARRRRRAAPRTSWAQHFKIVETTLLSGALLSGAMGAEPVTRGIGRGV